MGKERMPLAIPFCEVHGVQMEYERPRTYEQAYVGAMYTCPACGCGRSVLFLSEELKKDLRRCEHGKNDTEESKGAEEYRKRQRGRFDGRERILEGSDGRADRHEQSEP